MISENDFWIKGCNILNIQLPVSASLWRDAIDQVFGWKKEAGMVGNKTKLNKINIKPSGQNKVPICLEVLFFIVCL